MKAFKLSLKGRVIMKLQEVEFGVVFSKYTQVCVSKNFKLLHSVWRKTCVDDSKKLVGY